MSHKNLSRNLASFCLMFISLVLFAQAALAGPPAHRGSGAPTARKPATTQGDTKRVCIDVGVSKPIVRTIPYQRWPNGVIPTGKIARLQVSVVVRNHSTTDLNEPFDVSVVALQPGGNRPLWIQKVTRPLPAGKSQRLDFGFYYDFSRNHPAQFAMRAELVGTRAERNDCKEQNDVSQAVAVDAQRLADAAVGR